MSEKAFKTAVATSVTILAENYQRTVAKNTFTAYELGLRGLSPEQISIATQLALEHCRFMPPPAELRELITHRAQDRAVKAWAVFERAVVRIGYLRSVNFDDPIVNATIRALGGWQACCGMPADEFDSFLPKRFQETYCALLRTGISAEQAEPLLGWADQENSKNGFAQKAAVQVSTGLPGVSPAGRLGQRTPPAADVPRLELKKA